jgi:hypothetical protein
VKTGKITTEIFSSYSFLTKKDLDLPANSYTISTISAKDLLKQKRKGCLPLKSKWCQAPQKDICPRMVPDT